MNNLTPAQQRQQSNRTADGKYTTKQHSETDVDLGLDIVGDYVAKQRQALQAQINVDRAALQKKQDALTALEIHDLYDELRAHGVRRVHLERDFDADYDSPSSVVMGGEPEFIGGYQPTPQQEHEVQNIMEQAGLSWDDVTFADATYDGNDYGGITLDTSVDPAGVRREDAQDHVTKLLDTDETHHRIPGGLDPAKVTANSNDKVLNVEMVLKSPHLNSQQRMELILAIGEDWNRATVKSTSRPTKYGNVPSNINHIGGLKEGR